MDPARRMRLWLAIAGAMSIAALSACLGSLDYLAEGHGGQGSGSGGATASSSSTAGPGGGGSGGAPCSDVLEDADNCGTCGHSCLGGTCSEGRCQPVVVADGQDGPFGISVDDTHVYWANQGAREIRRAPKNGGRDEVLSTSIRGETEFVPTFLVVVGGQVVWTNVNAGQLDGRALMACPVTGGPPAGFGASAPDGNAGLAADGDTFWFANFGLGEVRIADFGQDAVTLLSGQDAPAQLAVDATHIYWTNDSAITSGDGVMRADRDDGSQVQSLEPNVDEATGIALDADSVYVTSDTRVLRVPKQGGDAEVLASSLFGPRGIVSAGDRIYWVTAGDSGGSTGTVMTVDAAGREEATVLATGQSSPVLIAADETQIFWTNLGNAPNTGSVMRLAR